MSDLDHWHTRITRLAVTLGARHPRHAADSLVLARLAGQIQREHHLVSRLNTVGDGIRSTPLDTTGGPGSVLDDEGHPMPPLSDPVGELVVAGLDDAPVTRQRRIESACSLATTCLTAALTTDDPQRRQRLVNGARTELLSALGTLHRTIRTVQVHARRAVQDDTGDPGCTSCARIRQWSPRHRAGLCRWCHRWREAHGAIPPMGVLEAHQQGRRITTRVVAEATRAKRKTKTKTGKRRR